jgi:Zn ribbon nucleic-acid-binding protein
MPAKDQRQSLSEKTSSHEIKLGDLECPRCKKTFTMSYWRGKQLVQARCLSCDLKWPRPDVV